ncbi:MAG TPA: hypothetical protein VNG32_03160 [Candidatus Dormibacteraeota bacterium]|nr:hypothetical protein [Candidatus Dormibacteraeota bacterium]
MTGKEIIRLGTSSENAGEAFDLDESDIFYVLDDLLISGSGLEPEDAVVQATGRTGVYNITNSVLGTHLVRISEAYPRAGTDYPGDC